MKDEGFLNRVVEQTVAEMRKRVDFIRHYSDVPIGHVKLGPAQFRQKYGISLREAQRLDRKHGPEAVQEILDVIAGGGQNAPTE